MRDVRYFAFDSDSGEHEFFKTKEECDKWVKEGIDTAMEEYVSEEAMNGGIFWGEIKQHTGWVETDNKKNYKYEYEDDIPEDDTESAAWPYDNEFDTIGKLVMVDVEEAPDAE